MQSQKKFSKVRARMGAFRISGIVAVLALTSVCEAGVVRPMSQSCARRVQNLCQKIYDYDVQGSCLTDIQKYTWPCANLQVCESIPSGGEEGAQDDAINECLLEVREHVYSSAVIEKCKGQVDRAKCLADSRAKESGSRSIAPKLQGSPAVREGDTRP